MREKNPPDLLVVCQVFYPELVSTGQTVTELMEELSAMGMRITVIAAQPSVAPETGAVPSWVEHQGITVRRTFSTRLPKKSFAGKFINLATFFASATWAILWDYRRTPLMLYTNPPYLPLVGWALNLMRGQEFGVVLYDIMPEQAELIEFIRPDGLAARIWRSLNKAWYQRARYVVVLSRDMLEGALKNANLAGSAREKEAREKTHVIHVWADDRIVAPLPKSGSTEARRLGVESKFVVQYSGNHGRFHDIETLLGVAKSYRPDEGVQFQFIGDGQKRSQVEKVVASGECPHVYLSGYVRKNLLADSLAMADLGVVAQLPGQERVCYPSKLLGIMAAGRAVLAICSTECEMARMIEEEEIGVVVKNGDVRGGRAALEKLRSDPARLARMGMNAVRVLRERFTLGQAARMYCELLGHKP